jgi:hypothetical protein
LDSVTAIDDSDGVVRRLLSTFAAHPDGVTIDKTAEDAGGVDFGDVYVYRLTVPAITTRASRRK